MKKPFGILVTGCHKELSRHVAYPFIDVALNALAMIGNALGGVELVDGGAPGVDTWCREWAIDHGIEGPTIRAEWDKYGRAAGPKRNQLMVGHMLSTYQHSHGAAFYDGTSRGTFNCMTKILTAEIPLTLVLFVNGSSTVKTAFLREVHELILFLEDNRSVKQ